MDIVSLPIVGLSTTPTEALKLMAEHKRSACVVDDGSSFSLLLGGDIAAARDGGTETLGSMPQDQMRVVHAITAQEDGAFGIDPHRPLRTSAAIEDLLGSVGSQYGALTAASDSVVVVTAHEWLADDLNLPGTYECNGATTHYFPPPRVREDQSCPSCLALGAHSTISFVP